MSPFAVPPAPVYLEGLEFDCIYTSALKCLVWLFLSRLYLPEHNYLKGQIWEAPCIYGALLGQPYPHLLCT